MFEARPDGSAWWRLVQRGSGVVLDPILSLRRRVRIVPGGSAQITFVTGNVTFLQAFQNQTVDMVLSLLLLIALALAAVVALGTSAVQWLPWLRTVAGLRGDRHAFDVESSIAGKAYLFDNGRWQLLD